MAVSKYIGEAMSKGSWIRKMFEEGTVLKKKHGADKVFDLSLGNPVIEPPPRFFDALSALSAKRSHGLHRYMQNCGYPQARERIAADLRARRIIDASPEGVVMTVGAAGGINVVLKTIADPGDEILILSPYFVEYIFYAQNHGAKPVLAETAEDFNIDLGEIERKITARTRAVIINSPNNPTGRIYPRESIERLSRLLERKQAEFGRSIYAISDEPYRELVYADGGFTSIASAYKNSFLVYSWSKSLSIPGERIGYVAVNPGIDDPSMAAGLTFSNRILGFVNAPASMQLVATEILDSMVDVGKYKAIRDRFAEGLAEAGYDFILPEGTFYFFPKSPIPDDVEFVRRALGELVLVVPGSGFGRKGHFRICFCVDDRTAEGGIKALARAIQKL